MKIQAFPIIAVVAALLSIVCGAPASIEPNERADHPKPEDRSCKKREADAQKAFKEDETVEYCNYFCKLYEGVDSYVERKYQVGTKCKYSNTLVSRCTEEGCPYPTNSGGDDKKGGEKQGQGPNDEQGKEKEKKEKKEESTTQGEEEKPRDEPNDEEEKAKEGEKEELTTQGDEGEEDNQKEKEPKEDEEKGKEGEEGAEGEEEEEEGELESESAKETSGTQ
uniref:Uncharacterized protein n=1 Tax=Ixodes ricinus TaxID=34613 RepID=V5GZV5_IXORI